MIIGEAIGADTDSYLRHLRVRARTKDADCVLCPVGTDDELRFIAHEDSRDAAQLGDRIQMSSRYGIEDIHGIVGRVGDVNVATRRMHGCVIEASGCAVFRQSYISDLS